MALTTKRIDKLLRRGEPGRHFDSDGMSLVVTGVGTGHFQRRYQLNGKGHYFGLGSARAFTLAEVRERNRRVSQQLADGIDPLAAKQAQKAAATAVAAKVSLTFKQAADRYIADNAAGWKSAVHGQQWIRSLDVYAHPFLGKLDVAAIGTREVLVVLEQKVEANAKGPAGKFWEVRNVTADRVRSRIELVLNYATARGFRPHGVNPAALDLIKHVLPKPAKLATAQPHAALDYRRVPELMAVLCAREGVAVQALQFLILTAARAGEALGATWDEVDLTNRTWRVPAARMKGGREHVVPLSPAAVALLEALYREAGNPYLFIGLNRPNLSSSSLATMLKRVGYGAITVHGFRSSFRTWAAERTDYPREIAELSLAHVVGTDVERRYKRTTLFDRRRALMEAWARYCTSPPQQTTGEVVPLRGAR